MDDVERSKQESRNAARSSTTRKRRPRTDEPVESRDETSATRPTEREQRSAEAENGSQPTARASAGAKTARPRRTSTTRKRRPPTDEPVELGDETAATRPTEREQRSAGAENGSEPALPPGRDVKTARSTPTRPPGREGEAAHSTPAPPAVTEEETARSLPTQPAVAEVKSARSRGAAAKAKTAPTPASKRQPKTPATRAERSAPAPLPATPAEAPAKPQVRSEICEIRWWRGFVKSDFYAEALRPDGTQYEVGRSPMFWWWRADQPERTDAAAAALQDLVERLMRAGWEPDGQGTTWYQQHFRRLVPAGLSDRLGRSIGGSRSPEAGGAA